jgi:hypothetical protein
MYQCAPPITFNNLVEEEEGSLEELEGNNEKYKNKIEEMLEEQSMQQVTSFKFKIAEIISKGKGEVEAVIHMDNRVVQSFNLRGNLVQITPLYKSFYYSNLSSQFNYMYGHQTRPPEMQFHYSPRYHQTKLVFRVNASTIIYVAETSQV